ncbi:MAG: hypothetical protein PHI02_09410 [Sulfurovaceae bacterium]|nr:hypothetical protein [Sulfurovaceae bacterium]
MSVASDRLNYITREVLNFTGNVSVAQVSRDTEIPYSTLLKVRRGEAELSSKYNTILKEYYSKNVYYNLRSTGLNSIQANRFRNGNVQNVSTLTERIYEKIDFYATGTTIMKCSKTNYFPSSAEIKKIYAESYKSIQKGLGKSQQSVEDWLKWSS